MVQPPVPPPPPSTPPYQPAGQTPYYQAPPPRKRVSPLWYVLGCGCLVVLIAGGIAAYMGYQTYQKKIAPEISKARETIATETAKLPTTTTTEATPATTTPAVNAQPGKEAALETALAKQSGWIGKVTYASSDWQRVKVWIGPANSEYTTALVLQWDDQNNAYKVESSTAIPQYEPPVVVKQQPTVVVERKPTVIVERTLRRNPATPPTRTGTVYNPPPPDNPRPPTSSFSNPQSAGGPGPTARLAVRTALGAAGQSGWIGKVVSSKSDIRNATVLVGPPHSEWVYEVQLKWDKGSRQYNVLNTRPLGN